MRSGAGRRSGRPGAAAPGPSRGVCRGRDAGEVGQRDAGRRERVADAAFKRDVVRVEPRLEPCGGAEIGARGHDAEDAGQPGHAHGVGRMRRLSRVPDDVEDLAIREVVDRQPVAPRPARAGVALVEPPGRFPCPRGALRGPHAHGADDAAAETGMRLEVAAKLALDRSAFHVRSAKPDTRGREPAPLLDAVEKGLAGGDVREDQGHAGGKGRLDMLDRARPFDALQGRMDGDQLVVGNDAGQQDRHCLAVLAS